MYKQVMQFQYDRFTKRTHPKVPIKVCLFLITPCLLTRFVPLAKTVLQNERSSQVSKFYTSL